MLVYGETHIGKVRSENQDAFAAEHRKDGISFGLVCDGMGGAAGGKIASTTACEVTKEYLSHKVLQKASDEQIRQVIKNIVFAANDKLNQLSLEDETLLGMGTTMVLALCTSDNMAYIANIGDSRAYLYRDGRLHQITTDHSAVQEMVNTGQITKKQAINHPQKNIITRAVGIEHKVEADVFLQPINEKDTLLLCSDGLTNFVSEAEIRKILSDKAGIKKRAKELISLANENGGRDNITVVLMKA